MSRGKPLYVDGRRQPIEVDLLEAALVVRTPDASDALCPVGRLDRVHCWGEVWWSARALAACGRARVPVAFHEGRELAALVLPRQPRDRSIAALLERAAERPNFPDRFQDWMRHEASLARLDAERRMPRHRPRAVGGLGPHAIRRRLEPVFDLWLRRRLVDLGVPPRCLGASSAGPNLAAAFAQALGGGLHPLAARLSATGPRPGAPTEAQLARQVVEGFEAEAPRLSRRFESAWARFERMVRDLAEGDDLWDG